MASLMAQMVKKLPAMWENWSIPGLGRSPGEGNNNPLQYSCLENPMDRGAWPATVHQVAKELNTTEQLTHTHTRKDTLKLKTIPYTLLSRSDHVQLTLWIHYCFLLHLTIRSLWVIICGERFWGKAYSVMVFPGGSVVKNPPAKQEM